jgi:2-oxoglutarate ferredoxin oxidoreductase subunit alpha
MQGNAAAAAGAYRVGCRFFAGYPITPSSEIMSEMAALLRKDGVFIQMEDEIASISAAIGASLSGVKAMTATSGPGFSLMQEGIGFAYFTETPIVVVDVQRAGPATGQASRTAQGDIMQMRYGSHGDVHPIALSPWSVQEMYDLTIRAFNLSEALRLPVIVAADESIAHAREPLVLPNNVSITNRVRSKEAPPFGSGEPAGVPPLPAFGEGAKLIVTGSTHDEWGFRKVEDPACHERLVTRLMNKSLHREDEITETESFFLDDATVAFFAFGISARSASAAVRQLRLNDIKVGMLRALTLWPFPEKAIRILGEQVRAIIVPELNAGMYAEQVRSRVRIPVHSVSQVNGMPISPSRLVDFAMSIS